MQYLLCLFPLKPRTLEKISGQSVYCFMAKQMQDETVKYNRQTKAWISHDLTQYNTFCRFQNTEIFLSLFQLSQKNRYEQYFRGK